VSTLAPRTRLTAVAVGTGLVAALSGAVAQTLRPLGSDDARAAALLLTDGAGNLRIKCLHGRGDRAVSGGSRVVIESVLDAIWLADGLHVAANVSGRDGAPSALALLGPDGVWKQLDPGVKVARFSREANALVFEVVSRRHVGGGIVAGVSTTKLVDLSNGAVKTVGELADPRWEADGKSILATRLDRKVDERARRLHVRWQVSRVRWLRSSQSISVLGQGDAQIPSPRNDAIAWRDATERPALPNYPSGDRCALTVGAAGVTRVFPVEGRLCLGSADDRAVRFSPDGKWLAFASFEGPVPATEAVPVGDGKSDPPMFLRLVSPDGRAHPAAQSVRAHELEARRSEKGLDPASMRGGYRWLDWSPASTAIVAEGPEGALSLFDLTTGVRSTAGVGRAPTFDPRGDHVLVLGTTGSGEEALVIHREKGDQRETLGRVRDARWLATSACEARGEGNGSGR
jgi:hypothetical protein